MQKRPHIHRFSRKSVSKCAASHDPARASAPPLTEFRPSPRRFSMSAAARRRHDPAGIIRGRPLFANTERGALTARFLCFIRSGEKSMRPRPRRQRLAGQRRMRVCTARKYRGPAAMETCSDSSRQGSIGLRPCRLRGQGTHCRGFPGAYSARKKGPLMGAFFFRG